MTGVLLSFWKERQRLIESDLRSYRSLRSLQDDGRGVWVSFIAIIKAMDLHNKKCIPCEGGTKPFEKQEIDKYLSIVKDWNVEDSIKITKHFKFKNFKEALSFVNKVGEIAEQENHHPNIYLYDWSKVRITLTTHAIKGLSINDFILASKIDTI